MFSTDQRRRRGSLSQEDEYRDEDADGDVDRALSILRQRYARGEIDLEEYERRLKPLLSHERVLDRR